MIGYDGYVDTSDEDSDNVGAYDPEDPPQWDAGCLYGGGEPGVAACLTNTTDGLVPVAHPEEPTRIMWAHPACLEQWEPEASVAWREEGERRHAAHQRGEGGWDAD